ncbi:RHS repeat domain-containing protein [Nonomuraea sp. NPDC003201]
MEYDLAGRLVKTTDANGNASVAEYDLAGRKTTVKDLGRDESSNNEITVERTYGMGYDAAGNQISSTSPEGYVTRQTFDALGRLTSLVEPVSTTESITTSFGFDATGARTRITDGRGNATWTSYNSLGLVETVTEPSTTAHPNAADRTWTHAYDAAGNPTATIQPGGVRIDRIFDHLDRLTKESGAGGGATTAERTFGYDLAGRRTTAGDLTVDYNDRSLPLKVSRGTVQETAYAYDGVGSPLQRIDASGTATFTYDSANRLKTATDPVTSRTLTYGYDAASRLKTITATGTASTQTIDYYDTNQVKSQTLKNGAGTQLASVTYGWDKDDNLTTKTTAGIAGAGTNTYGYDHAGRLTSWTAPGGATTAYEWDAAGNRTKAGNATFTYDERNRLTSGDGTDYTYTARGTLATSTKAGATTQYTFDAFDRLIADGDSLYSYDALNRMASRIRGTTKNTFVYSGLGNDLAAITDSGGAIQAKYARDLGGGLLGLKEGTGAAVAALSDLHGDLVATYTTTLQTSTAYDPFGTVTAQTGTKTNLGYQGEYTDPDTGKVNMHARWYQPGTGTFTSRDTAALTPSPSVQANRYTYANASPLTGTDPTGHYTIDSGSLGGTGYGGSGSSGGYTTIPAGGYSSSGSSGGGQCIGSCGREDGGGAIACTIQSCGSMTVDPSWARMIELENEKKFWLGQDEVERLGLEVMPNGRPVDQPNFWFASEKVQNEYMSNWSPTMTDKQLAFSWVAAGGLESFATMEKAAKKNANDVRLGEWRKMQQVGGKLGSGMYATKPKDGTSASRYALYENYKYIVRYWRDIERAAANHGIKDVNALAAVLMYESHWREKQFGGPAVGDNLSVTAGNEGASIGVSQLEIYKVRRMLGTYVNKDYLDKDKWPTAKLVDYMHHAPHAIHMAAAYMRYLKENVKGLNRKMTDMDAAIAYCTCSGAVMDPKTGVVSAKRYVAWANSGYIGRPEATKQNPENGRIAEERRNALLGYVKAAPELFACGRAACWTYM